MFRLFRHIRQRFFLEGKSSRYFGYAIGEIVLIVVGILIALQISNWNEERKEREEETEVLQGLQREFQSYLTSITGGGLVNYEQMMSAAADILRSLEAGSWVSEKWTLDEAIDRLLRTPTSDLGGGVREALVQGGRLEIISNQMLRERLANWPKYHQEMREEQLLGAKIVFDDLIPYFASQGVDLGGAYREWAEWPIEPHLLASDPEKVEHLLSDPAFRTLVQSRYALLGFTGKEYERAIEANQDILDLINVELTD